MIIHNNIVTELGREAYLSALAEVGLSLHSFCVENDLPYHYIWRRLNGKTRMLAGDCDYLTEKLRNATGHDWCERVKEYRGLS